MSVQMEEAEKARSRSMTYRRSALGGICSDSVLIAKCEDKVSV